MRYRVVCVSRAIGAGGESIGDEVATRLGFRYFDDEVISLAAQQAGIEAHVVAKAEHHRSLLTRLMDTLARPPMEKRPLNRDGAYYSPRARPAATLPQEQLRRLIHSAIGEIAGWGDAVIVAHAASIVLAERKDTLRVLVTASEATRRERFRLRLDGKLLDEQDAARAVAESDRERARYLERFFDLDAEPATLYDLVVNTDTLRLDQAVGAIVGAAQT
jgi:cytidylate kinase